MTPCWQCFLWYTAVVTAGSLAFTGIALLVGWLWEKWDSRR